MVPGDEMNGLHADAAAAVNLAVVGEVRDGMNLLLAGLHRAEGLPPEAQWRSELASCYRKALAGYCRQYRISPPPQEEGMDAARLAPRAFSAGLIG